MLNVTPQRLLGTLAALVALATPAAAQTTAESQLVSRLNEVRSQGSAAPAAANGRWRAG
ncbi:hypothetical protein [Deinococcus multiflagellatus]|uniref:Uncharacterized protein n=1 Tax=Deinococcus multiflagellatus TaxID=1656887 RepID=A0ABW1ZHG8_9DEIO